MAPSVDRGELQIIPYEPDRVYAGVKVLFKCLPNEDSSKESDAKPKDLKSGEDEEISNTSSDEQRTLAPALQLLQCYFPRQFERMQKRGDNFYGWVQQGVTLNGPIDRVNYGAYFNWRSNDYRLNQAYVVHENTLEHDGKPNLGYRVGFVAGYDAPFLVANGLFNSFTGFDPTSGLGVVRPASFWQSVVSPGLALLCERVD
jgi:hypothetical protein